MVKPEMRPVKRLFAAIHIYFQVHALTDAQIAQLRFLEIGIDPDVAQRANGHQALANLHIVPGVHVPSRDYAIDFRVIAQ